MPDIPTGRAGRTLGGPADPAAPGQTPVLELGIMDDAEDQFIGTLRTLAQEQRRNEREILLTKSRSATLTEEEKQRLRELYRHTATNVQATIDWQRRPKTAIMAD